MKSMRNLVITTQIALVPLISIVLIGCSQQTSAPVHDHAVMQAQQEVHAIKGYDWKITTPEAVQPGKPITLAFAINEQGSGTPLGELSIRHEKTSHLIIVSKDLSYFAHIHPEVSGPGKMQVQAEFPKAGDYVMYLQFAPVGQEEQTLQRAFQAGPQSSSPAHLKPDVDKAKTIDGYTYRLSSAPTKAGQAAMAALSIEKDGKPLTNIEPYLGAGGHAVLLSEDTKSFLHVHPASKPVGNYYQSPLQFHTKIAKPGLYKMWIQVQIGGKLKTVDFTFRVS